MSQQVQELIDKIKTEGIEVAEREASELKQHAQVKADEIIQRAKAQADKLIIEAKADIKKLEESSNRALSQAARDTLLSLRKEIEQLLTKIIIEEVGQGLTSDHLAKILTDIIKQAAKDPAKAESIQIHVSESDLKKLRGAIVKKLQKQIKQSITIQASENITKGLTISFDAGKSSFDFTDESLAAYLSTFLNTHISEILAKTTKL